MDGVDLHRFYAYQSTVSELEVHGAGADDLERRIFRRGVPPKVVPLLLLITRFATSPSAQIDIVSYSPWQRVSVDEVDVRVDISLPGTCQTYAGLDWTVRRDGCWLVRRWLADWLGICWGLHKTPSF